MHPAERRIAIEDPSDREALAGFVGRVVRQDMSAPVRLRAVAGTVQAWAPNPFDVLVTTAVPGRLVPADLTVPGSDLLAALSVVATAEADPGPAVDDRWRGQLPGTGGWRTLDDVPAAELDALAARGIAAARDGDSAGHPPATLLDETVLVVGEARVPMRCVLALAGMGLIGVGDPAAAPARVSIDEHWVRLDVPGGAVLRRRRPPLMLRAL